MCFSAQKTLPDTETRTFCFPGGTLRGMRLWVTFRNKCRAAGKGEEACFIPSGRSFWSLPIRLFFSRASGLPCSWPSFPQCPRFSLASSSPWGAPRDPGLRASPALFSAILCAACLAFSGSCSFSSAFPCFCPKEPGWPSTAGTDSLSSRPVSASREVSIRPLFFRWLPKRWVPKTSGFY